MSTILPLPPVATERRRSKIARLPKPIRDHLNQMIDDGVPYEDIRTQLGEHGQNLTVDNISEWKNHGGYADWVNEQVWRDEIRAQLDAFTDFATDPGADPTQLPLAGLELSLLQLCRQLRELGPGTRKEQFENDATKYLRMLNTLSRLTKSLLSLQQYRDTAAAKSARLLKHEEDLDPESRLTERDCFLDRADDLFGFKSAARLRRELPLADPSAPETEPHHADPLTSEIPNSQSSPAPGPVPKSQISNPQLPPPSPPVAQPQSSDLSDTPPAAAIQNQKSKIKNPEEHCLECGSPLPPLTPAGGRPYHNCEHCGFELPPPGTCVEPSTEQCPNCHANLPRLLPNARRPEPRCHHCGTPLPDPSPPPTPEPKLAPN